MGLFPFKTMGRGLKFPVVKIIGSAHATDLYLAPVIVPNKLLIWSFDLIFLFSCSQQYKVQKTVRYPGIEVELYVVAREHNNGVFWLLLICL